VVLVALASQLCARGVRLVDGGKGLPAFRNNGKGHFFFADGHVDTLSPDELKNKYFAISY
jgi:prepilin-type processing-associated H-X9-DG protein